MDIKDPTGSSQCYKVDQYQSIKIYLRFKNRHVDQCEKTSKLELLESYAVQLLYSAPLLVLVKCALLPRIKRQGNKNLPSDLKCLIDDWHCLIDQSLQRSGTKAPRGYCQESNQQHISPLRTLIQLLLLQLLYNKSAPEHWST